MGNKASIPEPKLVFLASKAGNLSELRAIRDRLLSGEPATPEQRAELLEWNDDDGRTALVVAAAKNHRGVVELLLSLGANVKHVSRKKDGGSALHEAVQKHASPVIVEALIRHGASPFVENSSGFTPLDYAIVRKDVHLVRRFEELGTFRGYLRAKGTVWGGLSKPWNPRWVAIVHRYPYPRLTRNEQVVRRLLLFYENAQHVEPLGRIYLDGSQAKILQENVPAMERICILTLHPSHPKPRGLHSKGGGSSGYSLFLKRCHNPGRGTEVLFPALEQFLRAVNTQQSNTAAAAQAPPTESDEEFAQRLNARLNPMLATTGILAQSNSAGVLGYSNQTATTGRVDYPNPSVGSVDQASQDSGHTRYPSIAPAGYVDFTPRTQQPPTAPAMTPAIEPSAPPQEATAPEAPLDIPTAPSAPPLEGYTPELCPLPETRPVNEETPEKTKASSVPDDSDDDDKMCVVCLSAPREAGFVHGASVHRCVCKECANELMQQEQKNCPMCRQKIDTVITGFY